MAKLLAELGLVVLVILIIIYYLIPAVKGLFQSTPRPPSTSISSLDELEKKADEVSHLKKAVNETTDKVSEKINSIKNKIN